MTLAVYIYHPAYVRFTSNCFYLQPSLGKYSWTTEPIYSYMQTARSSSSLNLPRAADCQWLTSVRAGKPSSLASRWTNSWDIIHTPEFPVGSGWAWNFAWIADLFNFPFPDLLSFLLYCFSWEHTLNKLLCTDFHLKACFWRPVLRQHQLKDYLMHFCIS